MGTVLKPEPPPKRDGNALMAILVRMPTSLVAEIEEAASAAGLSRNKAIAQLVRFALDANKGKSPKK